MWPKEEEEIDTGHSKRKTSWTGLSLLIIFIIGIALGMILQAQFVQPLLDSNPQTISELESENQLLNSNLNECIKSRDALKQSCGADEG